VAQLEIQAGLTLKRQCYHAATQRREQRKARQEKICAVDVFVLTETKIESD
jgi:hypothetical protein